MEDSASLIVKAQNGDITAFHHLFDVFHNQLKSYLYRILADRQDAEDLAHDTFIKSFDNISTFKGDSSLKTWVFAIATHLSLDRLRQRQRWSVDAQDQSRAVSNRSPDVVANYKAINQQSPHGQYEIREHIDFCFTCIGKTLPLEQQIALMLKDVYGFKVKEAASILNRSLGSTKHLLHNARNTMTDIFETRCSLVSKHGICYQCSELNGLFNPSQDAQVELMELELVQAAEDETQHALFELRTKLVQGIDPLNASGSDLHNFIMQRIRKVIGEIE